MKSEIARTPSSNVIETPTTVQGKEKRIKGKENRLGGSTSPSASIIEASQPVSPCLKDNEESLPHVDEPSPHFFGLNLEDVLLELIQNCQRTQASKISIYTSEVNDVTWLTLVNESLEIYRDRMATGIENNKLNEELHFLDDLEELGICHLTNRGVIVDSGGQLVTLNPEHFSGKKGFKIQPSIVKRGTRISFSIRKNELPELSQFLELNGKILYKNNSVT